MTNQNLMEWQIKLAGKKCPSYIGWCWPLMNLYLARGEKACLLGAYRTSSVSSVFGCTSNYSRRFWRSQRAQGPRCELLSAPGADCVRFSASPGRFRYLFCVSHIYRYGTLQLHIWWAKFVKGVIFWPGTGLTVRPLQTNIINMRVSEFLIVLWLGQKMVTRHFF